MSRRYVKYPLSLGSGEMGYVCLETTRSVSFQVERIYGSGGSKAVQAVADSAFGGRYDSNTMKLVIKFAM
jgi:hypothetical protein